MGRLAKKPGIDPVELNRTCHGEAWGWAYPIGLAGVFRVGGGRLLRTSPALLDSSGIDEYHSVRSPEDARLTHQMKRVP